MSVAQATGIQVGCIGWVVEHGIQITGQKFSNVNFVFVMVYCLDEGSKDPLFILEELWSYATNTLM